MFSKKTKKDQEDIIEEPNAEDQEQHESAEPDEEHAEDTGEHDALADALARNRLQRMGLKSPKKLAAIAIAVIAILVGVYMVAMPGKPQKPPVNLGTINIPDPKKDQAAQAAQAQQQAKLQPDVLVNRNAQTQGLPDADFRNGYEKTSQAWKLQVEQATKIQNVLKDRFKAISKEYAGDKGQIPVVYAKEIAQSYPGSQFNGKEGMLKLSSEYDVYFDSTANITKIVLNAGQYKRIYTFKSPTGALQYDYEIILGNESVTIDMDPNIPNNCRIKSIQIPDISKRIAEYFSRVKRIPLPEGDPAITVINDLYKKQVANTAGKKYDFEIFSEMVLSDPKIRDYVVNYAETQYTP